MGPQQQIERPELRLIAAGCRWPRSPARDAAVRAAASAVKDWSLVLRLAGRHRVAGLVSDALAAAGVTLPDEAASALAQAVGRTTLHSMTQARETCVLQQKLASAGIPVVAFKGVSLAQLAYGTLALGFSKDIDLLVLPSDAAAALQLLEDEGYSPQGGLRLSAAQRQAVLRNHKEIALRSRARELEVELHWQACGLPQLLRGIDARAPVQEVHFSGTMAVRTLRNDDLFAYLCVHGASHGWARLKWLADVNALLADKADEEIVRLYRHADSLGAGLCAGQTLLLRQDLLGAPAPAAIQAQLGSDRRVQRLVERAQATIIGQDAGLETRPQPMDAFRDFLMQLSLARGWVNPAPLLRYHLFSLRDIFAVPLPVALHWLYPLLRLPLWILRRMGFLRKASAMERTGQP